MGGNPTFSSDKSGCTPVCVFSYLYNQVVRWTRDYRRGHQWTRCGHMKVILDCQSLQIWANALCSLHDYSSPSVSCCNCKIVAITWTGGGDHSYSWYLHADFAGHLFPCASVLVISSSRQTSKLLTVCTEQRDSPSSWAEHVFESWHYLPCWVQY